MFWKTMLSKISIAEKQIMWQQKVGDSGNCMRHNNIRMVELPEKSEGYNSGDFVEKWLFHWHLQ